jgi:hypothetical protein
MIGDFISNTYRHVNFIAKKLSEWEVGLREGRQVKNSRLLATIVTFLGQNES